MRKTNEKIELAIDAGLATITLSAPPVHILDATMCGEITTALRALRENAAVKVVLFRSSGPKAFSAGASVEEHRPEPVVQMLATFHGLIKELLAAPALTIAGVQGVCLGGGLELAAACDMVLASERAKFGHPEILLGCFPPAAGPLLRRIVGRHKTAEIIASGETFDASEALRIGLVNHVYNEDSFPGACADFARALCGKSGAILRLAKRSYADLDREAIFAEIDRNETMYLDELIREPDMLEGIEAFLEKRAPAWSEGTS